MHRAVFAHLSEEEQDWLLSDFLLELREDLSMSVQDGRYAVAACQKRCPRRRYTIAWKVITAWQADKPPVQAPPMPEDLAMALSVVLAGAGRWAESLVTVLCFCGLLRVGEALTLRRESLVFNDNQLVILLRYAKTGEHQRAVITNMRVISFIRELLRRGTCPLQAARTSYSIYRRFFLLGLSALGCDKYGFRSHSLRRGGATTLFARGTHLPQIMVAGRWVSESSCRLYVRTGEAALIQILRSESQNLAIGLLSRLGSQVFECSK